MKIMKCKGCERKPFCIRAKYHREGDRIVIDKDGTLCFTSHDFKGGYNAN